MKYIVFLGFILLTSCNTLQKTDVNSSKSIGFYEDEEFSFNFSKDWLLSQNDTIIVLAPKPSANINNLNGDRLSFSVLTIKKNKITLAEFREKSNSKKAKTSYDNVKTTQRNFGSINKITDKHYIEKTKIVISSNTKLHKGKYYVLQHTCHHFFDDNVVYSLLFENNYKNSKILKKQADIVFDSFQIK